MAEEKDSKNFQLQSCWVDDRFAYDGTQLRSLFAYLEYGIQGDSVVSWRGSCDIPLEHMVDGEDKVENEEIRGSDMVHFIFEIFDRDLHFGVSFQRLFAAIVKDVMISMASSGGRTLPMERDGDDLFVGDQKFSISIASVSPVSCMIHFAVNVDNQGTPVKTYSLQEAGIDAVEFAKECTQRVQEEFETLTQATKKVHWLK